ncbi:MAG: hypothetical protein WA960_03160 [Tunicatimonas sp.]
MKYPTYLFFISALCALISISRCYSQQTDAPILWQVETRDGNVYYGEIITQSQEVMRLETESLGVINLAVENIKNVREVRPEELRDDNVWPSNAQATRYFIAPNAYGLRKGEAYYQNGLIFFNQASIGITDNFSMGLGMVPLFLFAGAPTPVWITPKFSVPVIEDKLNLGGGALIGTVIGEDVGAFGLAYGVVTVGDRNTNLNLGVGYGFADGEWGDLPLLHIGGMKRIGRRGYLLSENYLITTGGEAAGLISIGGRTLWNRFSLDYGAFIPVVGTGSFFAFPWVGFVIPLGK